MKSLPAQITGPPGPGELASALFPSPDDRARLDNFLTGALADANCRVHAGAVTPTIDLDAFGQELAAFDFQDPQPLDEMLTWTIAQLERGVVHINHPRYFGLFNPSATFPAQCADRIAATFNPATRYFHDVAGSRGDRDPCHPLCRAPRRVFLGQRGPLHDRRRRGELHGASLRA